MNKFAVAALSLALLGALPAAQAASVSVDAGTYVLSFDDSFLTGASVSTAGGAVTFSGLGFQTFAVGDVVPFNQTINAFDSYGKPYPVVITAKAGYKISGLTESIAGLYNASAGADGQAGAVAGLVSRWVTVNGADMLGQNAPFQYVANVMGAQSSGTYVVTGTLDIASVNSEPGAIALSALDLIAGAGAIGAGSGAQIALQHYQIGVQVTAVPEPETMALALAALGVIGFRLRRHQSA